MCEGGGGKNEGAKKGKERVGYNMRGKSTLGRSKRKEEVENVKNNRIERKDGRDEP